MVALTQAQLQDLLRRAQELHRAGDLEAAEPLYRQLAEGMPANADLRHLVGVVAYQRGDARAAIDHYREALRLRAAFPAAHNNLGLALKSLGDLDAATSEFEAALAADPRYAEGAYNLALVHEARGNSGGAEGAYRAALAQRADWPELLGNLGNFLRRRARLAEAEPLLERAAQLRGDHPAALGNLALLRLDQGRYVEARALAERAASLADDVAEWRGAAGTAARLMLDADAAVAHLERACSLAPGEPDLWLELGLARQQAGDDAAAQVAFACARDLAPGDRRVAWARALSVPAFVEDEAAARAALTRLDASLEALERDAARGDPATELDAATLTLPFALHYLADDVLALQRRHAALVAAVARRACAVASPQQGSPSSGRRIRVGFVSGNLRNHVVGRYFAGLVTGLPRDAFECFAWFTGEAADERTRAIAARVEHFTLATGSMRDLADAILAARLDVLAHLDIGLDPRALALASLRLAPVQIALPGHPTSSGLDSVDWFVGAKAVEPAGAQAHYTEKLELLPGLGATPSPPPPPGDGAWMHALRAGEAPLLACPQNLMKLAPAFDDTIADVLARSGARMVLFDRGARLTARVRGRLEGALARRGVAPGALHFEPVRPYAEYLGGIAAADLVLDTPIFSGGATSLDALGVGAAVLAFEGASARARQTSGMLHLIGAEELVARDAAGYAQAAQELLADRTRLAALRSRIAQRSSVLFDGSAALRAFGEFLRERARG